MLIHQCGVSNLWKWLRKLSVFYMNHMYSGCIYLLIPSWSQNNSRTAWPSFSHRMSAWSKPKHVCVMALWREAQTWAKCYLRQQHDKSPKPNWLRIPSPNAMERCVCVTLVRQEGLHWIWIHWNHNTRPSFIELFSSVSSHFHQSNYSTQLKWWWWWVAHIGRRAQHYLRKGKATTILSAVAFIRCVHFDLMLDSSWTLIGSLVLKHMTCMRMYGHRCTPVGCVFEKTCREHGFTEHIIMWYIYI